MIQKARVICGSLFTVVFSNGVVDDLGMRKIQGGEVDGPVGIATIFQNKGRAVN